MISNPANGWCNFKLGDFEDTPSYLTDMPSDLLDAFLDYYNKGMGMAWFDEEGTEFTLVINPYSLFIIAEREETPVLYDFSKMNVSDLGKELIEDIERDFAEWADFTYEDDRTLILQYKNKVSQKIKELKERLHYE